MYSLESFITFSKARNAIYINLLSILLRESDWIWKSSTEFLYDVLVIGIYTYTTHLLKCLALSDNSLKIYIRLPTPASFTRSRNIISEYTQTQAHKHMHPSWFLCYTFILGIGQRWRIREGQEGNFLIWFCIANHLLSCVYYVPGINLQRLSVW